MTGPISPDRTPEIAGLMASAHAAWSAGERSVAMTWWRAAAIAEPSGVAPYVNLARVRHDSGCPGPWIERAAALIAADDPVVICNLGVLAQSSGRADQALHHFRRALMVDPGRAVTISILARLPEVRASPVHDPLIWGVRALLPAPLGDEAWSQILTRLTAAGREVEAATRASLMPIPLQQCSDQLLQLACHLFVRTVRNSDALRVCDLLLERHPADANVRRIRALALRRSGDVPGAIIEARRSVVLVPGSFENLHRLALELSRSDDHLEAISIFRRALRIAPARRLEVIENLGAVLIRENADDEASAYLREALVYRPGQPQAYLNLSTLRFQSVDVAAAERFARLSTIAGPRFAEAFYNLAAIYRHQGRLAAARVLFDRAGSIDDKPMYRFVRAMLELGDGDPEDGVRRYEVRWQVPSFSSSRRLGAPSSLPLPVWQGELRPDATLAVWAEQGIGDEIWFAGYLPWAESRVGKVALEVAASLVPLMRRSFPSIDVYTRGTAESDAAMAAADLQMPLGGLMLPYGAGSRPVPTGYLRADPQRVEQLRARCLRQRSATRLIGIAWRSVKAQRGRLVRASWRNSRVRHGRSFEAPLDQWGALFALEDVVFLSLQYGNVADDVRRVKELFGVDLIVDPEIDAYADLDGFAAQVAAVDSVVSIANSTVAMAHALGKPVDVIPRIIQDDWRYARWAESTRWLPTARCTWQRTAHDWSTPIAAVAERLRREP